VSLGQLVWLSLAVLIVGWIAVTQLSSGRLPTVKMIAFGLLDSWLGRAILLTGWAELGWHLFCQHP
jgi:hypothetical protein